MSDRNIPESLGRCRYLKAVLIALLPLLLLVEPAHAATSCDVDSDCEEVVAPCAKEARCIDKVCEFNYLNEGEKCSYGDINQNRRIDFCLEEGTCDRDGLCIPFRDFCPSEGLDCVPGIDGEGDCVQQRCGDDVCSGGENPRDCPRDCESYSATCGDGLCEPAYGEDADKCRIDCGCGDGICENEIGEYDGTCPADCLPSCNGNGLCDLDEDSEFCATDCSCGDDICDTAEGELGSCPRDCEKCNGNSKCEPGGGENANTCRGDCSCGDGVCDPFERNSGVCPDDCGGCDQGLCQIPFGDAICEEGTCVIDKCNEPYSDCDKVYPNGCEVDTEVDIENCGGCGNDCTTLPRVEEAFCGKSTCGIAMCESRYDDCDRNASNGCETNLRSVASCGSCGNDCRALPNVAQATCSIGGNCGVATCDPGFNDCDGIASNGCETSGACAFCGDGNVDAGEQCDDGTQNGQTTCGCAANCTYPSLLVTCDDDAFCTESDTCDGAGACVGSGDTCDSSGSTPFCDEQNNECDECRSEADCDNGLACDGAESCSPDGTCESASAVVCGQNEECTEPLGACACEDGFVRASASRLCVPRECTVDEECDDENVCTDNTCNGGLCESASASGRDCDNGLFCDGDGTCDETGACVEPGSPCTGGSAVCDEGNNRCVECLTTADCGGGLLCEPTSGMCVECLSASDCPDPGNECLTRTCGASNACGVVAKRDGSPCSSDGDACDGTETCQGDGSSSTCQSSGVDPCASDPANPVCNATGSDVFECVGSCGDGLVGDGEQCDLGASDNNDDNDVSGCSTSCERNEGWRCEGGAESCTGDQLEAVCGDSIVIASREACDDGAANGSTTCGCTASCTFRAESTTCDDGQFCTVGDACDGEGACVAGSGSPCGLGADACREDSDTCAECLLDVQCNDSAPCNGQETCDLTSGTCAPGTAVVCAGELTCSEQTGACRCPGGEIEVSTGVCEPSACTTDGECDDGDVCNGVETCDTDIEQCVSGQALSCDDGIACNGLETCETSAGCVDGTAKTCGSGFECVEPTGTCESLCGNGDVDAGEECDDGDLNSDTVPDSCREDCAFASCGDGVVDSSEQCDDGNGTPGDGCSANCLQEECSAATVAEDCTDAGICQRADCVDGACFYNDLPRGTTNESCDADGVFCNGDEICSGGGACIETGDPCANNPRLSCSEELGACVECLEDEACDDEVFCNGEETCGVDGSCQPGDAVDCGLAARCDEPTGQCVSTCGNGICNSGETSDTCPSDCEEGEGDLDGDGIPDSIEEQLGTLPGERDSDGDGVADDVEVFDVSDPRDTDADGLINALDPDDDGDGIDTIDEDIDGDGDPTNDDTDGDGIPNYLDDDDDGDRVPSEIEAFAVTTTIGRKQVSGLLDSDEDGAPNYLDDDDDNDTVLTADEVPRSNSSPWLEDTDEDGIPNYIDTDDDGDGLLTSDEVNDFPPDFDGDGVPNHLDVDDDDDEVLTANEVTVYSSNPYKEDTDDDLLLDGQEVELGTTLTNPDTDNDGLLDGEEVQINSDPLDDDTDDDGLLDGEEVEVGTGVRNPDTDDDFLLDGLEIDPWGTDPLDEDTDDDTILDGIEVRNGTDPNDPNSGPETTGGESGGCQATGFEGWSWLALFFSFACLTWLTSRWRSSSARTS